jgi:hypothetical protein
MFVRQSQLTLLDDHGTPVGDAASPSPSASTATTPDDSGKSRSRLSRCVKLVILRERERERERERVCVYPRTSCSGTYCVLQLNIFLRIGIATLTHCPHAFVTLVCSICYTL